MMGDSGLQNNIEQIRLNCGKLKIRATALSNHNKLSKLLARSASVCMQMNAPGRTRPSYERAIYVAATLAVY